MLTLKQKGQPIAQIIGGKDNKELISVFDPDSNSSCCAFCSDKCHKTKNELLRCCDKCKGKDCNKKENNNNCCGENSIEIHDDGKLEILPNFKERDIIYVAGPSGSGKSTIASKIIEKFKDVYPKREVYIFSRLDKDPVLDRLKPNRIKIDESLVTRPIDIQTEIKEGALLLFDDVNTIQNPYIKHAIDSLMSDVMEAGRKLKIWLVITNHLVIPNEKKLARTILNEMHKIVFFPKSGSSQQITYALQKYFGLSKKNIEKILQIKSRWILVNKNFPQYVLHEKGCYLL